MTAMRKLMRWFIASTIISATCVAIIYAVEQSTLRVDNKINEENRLRLMEFQSLKLQQSSLHEPDKEKWVEKCLAELESIKVGMTRAEMDKWSQDGGLQGISVVRLAHPACRYFKIKVEFDCKRNLADQDRMIWSKDDKIIKVSKPYLERPFFD